MPDLSVVFGVIAIKHNARICVDRSQQLQGHDFRDTYAPVVSWLTVRLVLLLSNILWLKARQVDYTQVFPQAELNNPVYIRVPQGWHVSPDNTLQPHPNPKYNDTAHYIFMAANRQLGIGLSSLTKD